MGEWFFCGMSGFQIAVLCACAFLAGVNKTGIPGVGILMVPFLAMVFPAKMSTGLLLPLLATADVFAVVHYHRHAHWNLVLRLLPWSLTGIVIGSIIIRQISNAQLKPLIGAIVLMMLILSVIRRRCAAGMNIPNQWWFAALMGIAAGMTTQMANAAGPVMVIYLLAMQLPKEEYMGTGAWYFLIVNWLKVPLYVWDRRIDWTSFRTDLLLIPLVAVGAWMGIVILRKMPQKWFNVVIQALAFIAALHLCWSAFR
ncbi:MAG: sulfite exporter TauE/SafE family protein [Victivallales bacterium]|nr:sulfite exporter TauE/SafE family protein [Victivallales bacterium]